MREWLWEADSLPEAGMSFHYLIHGGCNHARIKQTAFSFILDKLDIECNMFGSFKLRPCTIYPDLETAKADAEKICNEF
jgi:hypothetical protein